MLGCIELPRCFETGSMQHPPPPRASTDLSTLDYTYQIFKYLRKYPLLHANRNAGTETEITRILELRA